jgi:hypothetical protein
MGPMKSATDMAVKSVASTASAAPNDDLDDYVGKHRPQRFSVLHRGARVGQRSGSAAVTN